MSLTDLNSFQRLNGRPCSVEQLMQEFGKLKQLLLNAENGLNPGFGGGTTLPVGTVLMWALGTGAIPAGWAIMDGVANAVINGGSGINMTNRFPRGNATTAGGTGGSTSYTPTGSITLPGITSVLGTTIEFTNDISVDVGSSDLTGSSTVGTYVNFSSLGSLGVTIPNHDDHYHETEFIPVEVQSGSGEFVLAYGLNSTNPVLYPSSDQLGTGDIVSHGSSSVDFTSLTSVSTNISVTMSDWDHDHPDAIIPSATPYDCTITGTFDFDGPAIFDGDADTIEPPYADLIFIERIS